MIQLARPADLEAVEALAQQVHALHVFWEPEVYRMERPLYCQARFDEAVRNRELYVAILDNQVAGYALIHVRSATQAGLVPRRVMLLDEFCVDETRRGQGIGTQMLEELQVLARAFGCTDLQLRVNPQNEAALAFYRKNGLTIQDMKLRLAL